MSNDVITKLFFELLLIALGVYGLGFGLSVLPSEFALSIIIVFGSMLVIGIVLYLQDVVSEHKKKKHKNEEENFLQNGGIPPCEMREIG
jgi:arginine exporter protein ArgO